MTRFGALCAVSMLALACSDGGATSVDTATVEDALGSRPFDATHARLHFGPNGGDRFEHGMLQVEAAHAAAPWPMPLRHRHPHPHAKADWSYNVVNPVNGGAAVYITNQITGTPACTDSLYVPVNGNGTNFYAFTNLYNTCGNTVDPKCSPSPAGHCPKVVWSAALTGAMNRNSVTTSPKGDVAYVTTTSGFLYALNTAAAAATRVAWTLSASADTGDATATFVGSTPWVDYPGGNIYTAVQYANGTRIRVYKLTPAGAISSKVDIAGDGVQSGVLLFNGFLYLGSTSGKLYKIQDGAALTVINTGGWPKQLTAEDADRRGNPIPVAGKAILGTPSIDVVNNILLVAVNNVMWSVRLSDGVTSSVELGWQNGNEARLGDVSCYTSPYLYSDANTPPTVFVAHGKNQNDTGAGAGPRMHRRTYQATGVFDTNNLTSTQAGNGNDLSYPRSSPLIFQPTPASPIYAYIGDDAGNLLRWQYTNAGAFTNQTSFTIPTNPLEIDSPIVIDTTNGNIYFGSNNGRVYQINQSSLQ